MGGAVLQLVSYGKQNEYLISNPSISYFKYVHKRHTNFAIESIGNNFTELLSLVIFISFLTLRIFLFLLRSCIP